MCGIAGILEIPGGSFSPLSREALQDAAVRMAGTLLHRGPDRGGSWADESSPVAFGFRRLAILDLSDHGDQPMRSACGRYTLVFNGEIYNFRELRERLEAKGARFSGRSDTEVILAGFSEWGVCETLPELNGMFALGVWDRELRELTLARDRFGEKPLYYGMSGGRFVFGSELKALRASPGFAGEIDREALSSYLRFACVPGSRSIYTGFSKLSPGYFLRVKAGADPEARPYWSLEELVRRARSEPFTGSDEEGLAEAKRLLSRAVARRMISDVPLGAFLSGGIDSSLIVALMQAQSGAPVRTFTIGFEEKGFDESAQARAVAERLGTSHTEAVLSFKDALAMIPKLPGIYDEPFSDSSQLASCLLARSAREHVTVCLSGDAGDELFAGYNRHFAGDRIWRGLRRIPAGLRRPAAGVLAQVPASFWRALARGSDRPEALADKLRKLVRVLGSSSSRELYWALASQCQDPDTLVLEGGKAGAKGLRRASPDLPELEGMTEFQYLDLKGYLPDDILTKVDRATMAASLEARVPFLDPEVARFAWTLPERMKAREGRGKWVLRALLARYIGPELVLAPKRGFEVPIGEWLRGPLRSWCEDLLSEARIRREGYLNSSAVRALWREHLEGRRDRRELIWGVLMFQAWLEANSPMSS